VQAYNAGSRNGGNLGAIASTGPSSIVPEFALPALAIPAAFFVGLGAAARLRRRRLRR